MKQTVYKLIRYSLINLALLSCFKPDETPPVPRSTEPAPFPKDALPYLQMPDRTYAYKDSATGSIDTVKILYCSISIGQGLPQNWSGPPLSAPYFFFEQFGFSLVLVRDSSDWLSGRSLGADQWGGYSQLPLFGSMKKLNWYGTVFSNYIAPTSMTVESKNYNDVVRSPYDLHETDDEFYWAKGVGIIKFTIRDSSKVYTYTLVN